MTEAHAIAGVPMRWVGPLRISGNVARTETQVPLATYESPLWPSVGRGAKVSRLAEKGIVATLVDERMTRSVLVEATDAATALAAARSIHARIEELREVVRGCSRFAQLIGIRHEVNANLLFLRFEFSTGDASGHNMATLASDVLLKHILQTV
ncbi:hydroxymethylglutaryl-CoA reductase, partial [Streptomyces galbus]|nr:hydroxymethylglutaryl-CoA reductase [Streptomyces galbus]